MRGDSIIHIRKGEKKGKGGGGEKMKVGSQNVSCGGGTEALPGGQEEYELKRKKNNHILFLFFFFSILRSYFVFSCSTDIPLCLCN